MSIELEGARRVSVALDIPPSDLARMFKREASERLRDLAVGLDGGGRTISWRSEHEPPVIRFLLAAESFEELAALDEVEEMREMMGDGGTQVGGGDLPPKATAAASREDTRPGTVPLPPIGGDEVDP